MSELNHYHTITEALDKEFKLTHRKDPITHERFEQGDSVVFCAGCGSAFLPESWAFMGYKHCGQVETLENLPAIKELRLQAPPVCVKAKKEKNVKRRFQRHHNLYVAVIFGGITVCTLLLSLFLNAEPSTAPAAAKAPKANLPSEAKYANLKYHSLIKQEKYWRAEEFVQELLETQPNHPAFLALQTHYAKTKEEYLSKIERHLQENNAQLALSFIEKAESAFKDKQMGLPTLRHSAYLQLAVAPTTQTRKKSDQHLREITLHEAEGFRLQEDGQTISMQKDGRVYAKVHIPRGETLKKAGFLPQQDSRFITIFVESEKRFWRYTLRKDGQGVADFYEWEIPQGGGVKVPQASSFFLRYHADGLLELRDIYEDNLYSLFRLPQKVAPKHFYINFEEKSIHVYAGEHLYSWEAK